MVKKALTQGAEEVEDVDVEASKAEEQPQGNQGAEIERLREEARQQARKEAELELRHEITAANRKVKEWESKAQLGEVQTQELKAMRAEMNHTQEMLATLLDLQSGVTDAPQRSYKQALEERRKTSTPAIDPNEIATRAAQQFEARHLDRLAKKANLEDGTREFRIARDTYQYEGYDAAVDYLESLTKKTEEPPKRSAKQRVGELEEEGYTLPKAAYSGGGSRDYDAIAKRFSEDPFNPAVRDEYSKARRERGVE